MYSLKTVFKDVVSFEQAASIASSLVSSNESEYVEKQIRKFEKIIEKSIEAKWHRSKKRFATNKKIETAEKRKEYNISRLEKKWIKYKNPLVTYMIFIARDHERMLRSSFTALLLLKLPVSMVEGWNKLGPIAAQHPDIMQTYLKNESDFITKQLVVKLWNSPYYIIPDITYNALTFFLENQGISYFEKLSMIDSISDSRKASDPVINEELKLLQSTLLERIRKEYNLIDVPDSWIREVSL